MPYARCPSGFSGASARLLQVLFDEPKTAQDAGKYRAFLRELLRERSYGAARLFDGFRWQDVAHQIDRGKETDVMDGPHLCAVQAVAVCADVSTPYQGAQRETHGMWRQDALFSPVLQAHDTLAYLVLFSSGQQIEKVRYVSERQFVYKHP